MRNSLIILSLFISVLTMHAQNITGEWNGTLEVQGMKLRLVFHISASGNGYTATLDSPDQGAAGIPVTRVSFENPDLSMVMENLKAEYNGILKDEKISGTFRQAGMSFPLDMGRAKVEKKPLVRPQEPKEPFPYHSKEVTFLNEKENIKLAGTLTLPRKEGKFPAVVLITGSGPQNRNEEVFGHKPFLVLADYLTRNGIAVLRFDDRGTFESGGNFKTATTFDFANDVEAAVRYLLTREEINRKKIGLIGHSEGGIIAPIVAGRSGNVSFIVMMAGTSIPGDQLLLKQSALIQRASGVSEDEIARSTEINKGLYDLVIHNGDSPELAKAMEAYLKGRMMMIPDSEKRAGMKDEEFIKMALSQLNNPWMISFIRYNPAPALEKVKCPVLAINGSLDLQVPPENLEEIRKSLIKGGNKKYEIREYPGLNHLFQVCTTGLPAEYIQIEQTISPKVLDDISGWILSRKK